MIILLLLIFILILVLEAPKMLVKKQTKDLLVFMGLWSFALLVALLQTLHVELPNPIKPVLELIKPFVSK